MIMRILTPPYLFSVFPLFISLALALTIPSNLHNLSNVGNPLGINCRGSGLCEEFSGGFQPDYIGTMIRIANGSAYDCPSSFSCGPLDDSDIYLPNDHIVCLPQGQYILGGICAFTQGNNVPLTGVVGALLKRKLRELRDHGCVVCGSVPLGGGNDPNTRGILTVNYISGVACRGLCPPRHYSSELRAGVNGSFVRGGSDLLLDS